MISFHSAQMISSQRHQHSHHHHPVEENLSWSQIILTQCFPHIKEATARLHSLIDAAEGCANIELNVRDKSNVDLDDFSLLFDIDTDQRGTVLRQS